MHVQPGLHTVLNVLVKSVGGQGDDRDALRVRPLYKCYTLLYPVVIRAQQGIKRQERTTDVLISWFAILNCGFDITPHGSPIVADCISKQYISLARP